MTMATKYQPSLYILLLLLLTAGICPATRASRSLGAASVGTPAVSTQGKRSFNDEKPFFKGTSTFSNPPRIPPSSYGAKAANNVFKDEKPFFKGTSTFFNPPRIPPNSYPTKAAKSVFKDEKPESIQV